jgi:hypothetical protein
MKEDVMVQPPPDEAGRFLTGPRRSVLSTVAALVVAILAVKVLKPAGRTAPAEEREPDREIPAAAPSDAAAGFFTTLRGSLLSSIPALSALTFVIVAVKVFRASGMEATTTVAIVNSADVVTLLKGVILTLLPGFLAAVAAAALWWWADAMPADDVRGDPEVATRALLSPQAGFAWAMVTMTFFTISWPIFLFLLVPALYVTVVLVRRSRPRRPDRPPFPHVRRWLKGLAGTAAALAIGFLTLAPSVWVPLRTITIVPGHAVVANGKQMPPQFAAYVLDSNESGASLLLARPRAVVQVGPEDIASLRPLCVTPEARTRFFYLRLSQVLGIDPDNHSPYPLCPELDSQSIFGS